MIGFRPLYKIAYDIFATWPTCRTSPAQPYLRAMAALTSIHDTYGADSAKSVVLYFLANAGAWRGEDARRIKAELKQLLEG